MADRDDSDRSLGGNQGRASSSPSPGGGSYAGQDRAPSTASSNRNSGGNGYGFGGGGGATAHSVERGIDRSLSGGGNVGSNVGGRETSHSVERGIDRSLGTPSRSTPTGFQGAGGTGGRVGVNPDRFGGTTPTRGTARVTNDLPTGFNPARIGDTIRASLNNPIDYDPITGMVGSAVQRGAINPNINPSRFGAAAATPTGLDPARLGDPTAGTSLPNTGLPTGMDPARFGGTVDPAAGVAAGRFGYGTDALTGAPPAAPAVEPTTAGTVPTGLNPARFGDPLTPAAAPAEERFGPTGFGAAIAGPVTPVGVTPPSLKAQPNTRIDLASAPKANFVASPGFRAPNTDVIDKVTAAWAAKLGADNVRITGTPHGGLRTSKKGSKSGRHGPTTGSALDYGVQVRTENGWRSLDFGKAADLALANDVAEIGARDFGLKGYGVGNGYMSNAAIHHDVVANPGQVSGGDFEWQAANEAKTKSRLSNARAAYDKAGAAAPAPPQSVASMLASPAERTPQMAALDELSGASGTNTQIGRGTDPTTTSSTAAAPASTTPASRSTPAAAGGRVTAEAPGTNNFPATPPSQAQAEGFPSFKTPATGYKRSGLGTVLGLGIDALASVAGGPVAMAATGGAYLLTGDSLGGMTADMIGGKYGPNQYAPGKDMRYSGDRTTTATAADAGFPKTIGTGKTTPAPTTPAAPTTPTADEFVSRYIDPKYPTPFENWGEAFGWKEPV
jgi:hypothetical protein